MKRLLALGLVVVAALVFWYIVSPGRTFERLRAAAAEGDVEKLNHYVDFPVVRENLKADVKASLRSRVPVDDNPVAELGLMVGDRLIEGLVDTFVSPSAIAAVTRGRRPNQPPEDVDSEPDYTIHRNGLSRFTVEFDTQDERAPKLIFSRRAAHWQLTRIDLGRLGPR
ncbi:MAG TPA: DUF2939 domain-containing protein [Longimicrobiales bacterium]|nr:DUF2939 domain-containing protein [Longimicrobiales bacterium]